MPANTKVFHSLVGGGLDFQSLPMRLYTKGNKLFWNPAEIDFEQDARDWAALPDQLRAGLTDLVGLFIAGEEAVTRDIRPFADAMAAEGRFGDEMYLSQFAFEESRHVEVFRRWLDAVGVAADLNPAVAANAGHRHIFTEALPEALDRLLVDPSPANQVRASITYNHVVEGVLALTGYYMWNRCCRNLGVLPGMRTLIAKISQDERRHMAWGTYTCRRHVAADASNWEVAEETMKALMPYALRQIDHCSLSCPPELFGVPVRDTMLYAAGRARRRLNAIAAARGAALEQMDDDTLAEEIEERFAAEDERNDELDDIAAAGAPIRVTAAGRV